MVHVSCEALFISGFGRFTSDEGRRIFLAALFQRNGNGDSAHDIVKLEVPLRAESMAVVTVDADL